MTDQGGFRIREGVDLWVGMQGRAMGHRGTPVGIGALVGGASGRRPPPVPPPPPAVMLPARQEAARQEEESVVVHVESTWSEKPPPTPRWGDFAFFLCCFLAFQAGAWGVTWGGWWEPGGPECGSPVWQHALVPVLAFYMGWRHSDVALQVCGLVCSVGLSWMLAIQGEGGYVTSKLCMLVVLASASVYASGRLWVSRGGKGGSIPMGGVLVMLALLAVAIQDPSVVLSVWGLMALCTVWM